MIGSSEPARHRRWLEMAARMASGIGAILLNLLIAKMVADWFASRDTAIALGFHLASSPLGLGLALVTLAPFGETAGIGPTMVMTAVAAAIALVLVAALYAPLPGLAAEVRSFRPQLSRREWLLILIAGIVWALFNGGIIIAVSFAPDYLTHAGYSLRQAGLIASLPMWTCAPALVLGGYVADRLGPPNLVISGFLLLGTVSALAILTDVVPVLWFILLGLGFPGGPHHEVAGHGLGRRESCGRHGCVLHRLLYWNRPAARIGRLKRDVALSPSAPIVVAAGTQLAAIAFLGLFRPAAEIHREANGEERG